MSRTDHHAPYWVRALHTHYEGGRTRINHDPHCVEYRGYRYGQGFVTGPLTTTYLRVPVATAEANGWRITWVSEYPRKNGVTYCMAEVPFGPFPCTPDTRDGRCARIITHVDRRDRWYCSPPSRDDIRAHYYGPERRAVRDSLRDAAKIHRGTRALFDDADEDYFDALDDIDPPTRQARRSTWAGGWWD